jgi:hypothetical protein
MIMTTTTTTTTNTTNTTNTNTNTAQLQTKRASPEEEERLRDLWENRVVGALFRKLKREVRAARALLWTPGWVEPDLVSMWFMPQHAADVTRHAALAEECLDNARAHAKRKGRSLPPLEYLPRCILESEALEPRAYLKRWKRNNNNSGRLPFFSKLFSKVFGQFPKVWKSLEKLKKSLEKLFQTLFARNYYFNVIINSIIFPARVEIHETRFVAGTFTQPSERPVIFQKILVILTFSKLFSKLFPKL